MRWNIFSRVPVEDAADSEGLHRVNFDGDPEGHVAIDYGVYGAPETFLIDEHGKVLYKYVGVMTDEVWKNSFLPRINNESGVKESEGTTCS